MTRLESWADALAEVNGVPGRPHSPLHFADREHAIHALPEFARDQFLALRQRRNDLAAAKDAVRDRTDEARERVVQLKRHVQAMTGPGNVGSRLDDGHQDVVAAREKVKA